MPIVYEVDSEQRLLIARAHGRIVPAEVHSYVAAIIDDPSTDGCDELLIVGDIDVEEISAGDIRAIARRAADSGDSNDFRVAVVAARDADFGLFRMYQAFRDLQEDRMAIFRTVEDACEWLGVKVP